MAKTQERDSGVVAVRASNDLIAALDEVAAAESKKVQLHITRAQVALRALRRDPDVRKAIEAA